MLINTSSKLAIGDVVGFKIITGDEVIAKIEEINETEWVVSNPCTLMPSPQGLGLIPSMFSLKDNAKLLLNRNHVIFYAEVDERLRTHYIEQTTGIQTLPKGQIIT